MPNAVTKPTWSPPSPAAGGRRPWIRRCASTWRRARSARTCCRSPRSMTAIEQETLADTRLPAAGQVWWRAQMRARHEAAAVAARPVMVAQAARRRRGGRAGGRRRVVEVGHDCDRWHLDLAASVGLAGRGDGGRAGPAGDLRRRPGVGAGLQPPLRVGARRRDSLTVGRQRGQPRGGRSRAASTDGGPRDRAASSISGLLSSAGSTNTILPSRRTRAASAGTVADSARNSRRRPAMNFVGVGRIALRRTASRSGEPRRAWRRPWSARPSAPSWPSGPSFCTLGQLAVQIGAAGAGLLHGRPPSSSASPAACSPARPWSPPWPCPSPWSACRRRPGPPSSRAGRADARPGAWRRSCSRNVSLSQ